MKSISLLSLVIGLPGTLPGQQRWERQVQERVARAIETVGSAPHLAVAKSVGMLNIDEAASIQATLVQGTPYAIIAVCDDDCSRLQLTLMKSGGSEIAKERNSESLPTLHFTSDTTMAYGIRVTMEGCRWNPCWYAVAVIPLGKNPP